MKIDPEVQKLIDEFVEQVEKKEGELTSSKRDIDAIISNADSELSQVTANLEAKFNTNEISEEEYLVEFRKEKANILKNTKEKLDSLLAKYQKIYSDLGL